MEAGMVMGKRKEDAGFNAADYAYLDDLPLLGWQWEFERRTETYRNTYEKGRKPAHDPENLVSADRAGLIFWHLNLNPAKTWEEVKGAVLDREYHVSRNNPVRVVNLKWADEHLDQPIHHTFRGREYKQVHKEINPAYPADLLEREMGRETVLMALMDMNAPTEKIMRLIEREIKKWKRTVQPSRTGRHPWDMCLKVYDLKKQGHTIASISKMLGLDERSTKRYLQKARLMIDKHKYQTIRPLP